MRAALLAVTLAAVALISAVALAATPVSNDPTPQQITALKKQVRDLRSDKGDLQDTVRNLRSDKADLRVQIDAQDALIEDQSATIARLRARDPLDQITARDPDGLWAAAQAIWRAFPVLPAGSLCGYDRASTQNDGLTPASLTFYSWQVC